MTTPRRLIIGLLATATVLAITAGIPTVLVSIGAAPAPAAVPTWEAITAALTTRDDGTLALQALAILAWGAWLFLTGAILLEITARLRGLSTPHLPGLALPQAAARGLVGAAVLLFVAAPPITTAPTATAATAPMSATGIHAHDGTVATTPTVAHQGHAARADLAAREHTVTRGESLWSIAQDHLGDGARYPEIADLNTDALGGRPAFLLPGTVLTLPATDPPRAPGEGNYTVRRGDTLSGIADKELGDAGRYPEIFDASQNITQPGGRHLSDPDVIDIGWTLAIPEPHGGTATAPVSAAPQPPETETEPLPSPSRTPATGPTAQPDQGAARADAPPPSSASRPSVAPEATSRPDQPSTPAVETSEAPAPWLLAGLAGGPVLAGSMWILLRQRHVAQLRHRRPGRTIATPPPSLAPVEKTLATLGQVAGPTVELMDDALRRLASTRTRDGQAMPQLATVELGRTDITLHLSSAATLPSPWVDRGDGRVWALPATTDPRTLGEPSRTSPPPTRCWSPSAPPTRATPGCSTARTTPSPSPVTPPTPPTSPGTSPPRSPATPGRPGPPSTASEPPPTSHR